MKHKPHIALLLAVSVGCSNPTSPVAPVAQTIEQADQSHQIAEDKTTMNRLNISKYDDDIDQLVAVGSLVFEGAKITLSTEGSSSEQASELQAAWTAICEQDELVWKQSVPDEVDGQTVTRVVGKKLKPSDPNYIYAVLNTLERKFGFQADLAQ